MPTITLAVAAALITLGLVGFFATGASSPTALIPALFGLIFAGLGLLARQKEAMRKHAVHVSLVVALLGVMGASRGLTKLPLLLTGGGVERPIAVIAQSAMALICAAYLVFGVRTFINARQR